MGVQVETISPGDGRTFPKRGQTCVVHYTAGHLVLGIRPKSSIASWLLSERSKSPSASFLQRSSWGVSEAPRTRQVSIFLQLLQISCFSLTSSPLFCALFHAPPAGCFLVDELMSGGRLIPSRGASDGFPQMDASQGRQAGAVGQGCDRTFSFLQQQARQETWPVNLRDKDLTWWDSAHGEDSHDSVTELGCLFISRNTVYFKAVFCNNEYCLPMRQLPGCSGPQT